MASSSSSTLLCVSCDSECGAHKCRICNKSCHAIEPCSVNDHESEEEGYGAPVTCKKCSEPKKNTQQKRSLTSWLTTSKGSTSSVIGTKRGNDCKSRNTNVKAPKKTTDSAAFKCVECFSGGLKGEKDKGACNLSRSNPSTISRHKERHHKDNEACTIVPSDSVVIRKLKQKFSTKETNAVESIVELEENKTEPESEKRETEVESNPITYMWKGRVTRRS